MFNRPRKSNVLHILEALRKRSTLSTDQQAIYERHFRGYIGEVKFAKLLREQPHRPYIPLFDLQLKIDGSESQIDNLLIFQHHIYLLEIKNFQGDYYTENNRWYAVASKDEIKNPLHQLTRTDLLLREFLKNNNYHLPLKSFIIFIHQGFQLYQAPLGSPIIFHSQLERFMRKLQTIPCQLHSNHQKLANQLKAAHLTKSTYEQIPDYNYSQLKKGMTCKKDDCVSMMHLETSRKFRCNRCNAEELVDHAVLRNLNDFQLLFPKRIIDVSAVEQWFNYTLSKASIRRILTKHFSLVNKGKYSHYIYDNMMNQNMI